LVLGIIIVMAIFLKYFNFFYIFIVLIWEPLQSYILHIDGMRRTLFFLTIPVLITNILFSSNFKKLLFYKPITFWGIWVIYSMINSLIKGSPYEGVNIIFFIGDFFVAFIVMIVICNEYLKNGSKLLKFLTITIFVYVLMGVSNINIGVLGNERFIDDKLGNLLPLNIVLLIFFICLRFVRKEIRFWIVLVMLISLLLIIVFSGTRKALGGALIIIIGTVLSFVKFKSIKNNLIIGSLFFFLFIGYNYVIENTIIGDRMSEVDEVGWIYNTTNYPILNLLGDRSYHYILGWDIFTKNPITGIGLGNFKSITLTDEYIHSEYIVQLAECGLIGSILFLIFIFWIGLNLFKCWKDNSLPRNNSMIIIGGFLAILFIGFTTWIYSIPFFFVGFGIIIGYLKQIRDIEF
jgi:O-antigen ligase